MRLLGIDPGTATTGYAVIEYAEDAPTIKQGISLIETSAVITPANMDMHSRLDILYRELNEISLKFSPDLMVIERLFFNTNVKTAMTVGQARGVSLLVAAHGSMNVVEYTALEAKKIVSGYGRSSKKEMQEAVRKYMGMKDIIKPDDASDAVAMVICHLHRLDNAQIT